MHWLIRHCIPYGSDSLCDVEISNGVVTGIHPVQQATDNNSIALSAYQYVQVDANGAALLPGLHDHHIHLVSLAASLYSLDCATLPIAGTERDPTATHFANALQQQNSVKDPAWLRVIRYHPEIAGDIDRHWLDRYIPDRPTRVQHRGGRLWVLNSVALDKLGLLEKDKPCNLPGGIEFNNGQATGRLYECDQWLRDKPGSQLPSLAPVSQLLASYGITGITDTTPHNGPIEWQHFYQAQQCGELLQQARMMGSLELPASTSVSTRTDTPQRPIFGPTSGTDTLQTSGTDTLQRLQIGQTPEYVPENIEGTDTLTQGEYKIHLLESQLPGIDLLCRSITSAHASGRNVAIHCVTLTELVFALACLESAGIVEGDRIEHAAVTPPAQMQEIKRLGLRVVTQPHFIAERGDSYLRDVDKDDQPWLYRLQGFIKAGIPLAAGSDAPFGKPDPWRSMLAATTRQSASGKSIQPEEKLSPEQALALFTSNPATPGIAAGAIKAGNPADLCLLNCPWSQARKDLSSEHVRMTWAAGKLIYNAAG